MTESRNGNVADAQSYSSLRDLRDVPEVDAEPGLRALGELIHGMRRAKGWSRLQLSKIAEVNSDTISNVELAVHVPRSETLRRLGLALIESAEPWSTEMEAPEDERRCACAPESTTDREAPAPAVEDAQDTGSPVAPPTARDGFFLVEKTIVTTETWRAPEQRVAPEVSADDNPA